MHIGLQIKRATCSTKENGEGKWRDRKGGQCGGERGISGSSQGGRGAKINRTMPGRIGEKERKRGEVTRRKLMHGQLSESRRQRKTDAFMSMSESDTMEQTSKFSHTHTMERGQTQCKMPQEK